MYTQSGLLLALTVDANRFIEYEMEERSADGDGGRRIRTDETSLPIPYRSTLRYYDDIESVNIDLGANPSYYYVARQPNNLLFDSFSLHKSGRKEVTIWVFQMAFITKVHGASKAATGTSGLEILDELKERLLSSNPGYSAVFRCLRGLNQLKLVFNIFD
ncbi:hypothetical protein H1R20_g6137, partial [Candolleomyces eurysporus]